jgi:hypothetical protein
MTIGLRIRHGIAIRGTKVNIEIHRSIINSLITKSSTSKETLYIILPRDKEATGGRGNLNPKKLAKKTKVSHNKIAHGDGS